MAASLGSTCLLDDEEATACGRCDNCAGARFDQAVSAAALDTARGELGRPGVEVEPRKMWPTGLAAVGVDRKGRIPAGELSGAGRALGRLSDIGWGNRLRPMLTAQAPDAPVPDEVADDGDRAGRLGQGPRGGWAPGAVDAVPRPVGVVTVASHSRPQLVQPLGHRIAEVGRMPFLGSLGHAPGADGIRVSQTNSAHRVRALHETLVVGPELAGALAQAHGPVLLVDDLSDTGWTLAVAARPPRRAGADAVFPLVLAVQA
ncbi:hypothetical protein FHX80_114628 [Streptomyces brevispora]|uniref:ATP-dependent DNA helicase RecQ n=1 Tax=Streptomyces brevispora TaxID=887462 RepID=A0A561V3E4_9ACTN|nr:hypothetical protein FHX80_114628 [Streptomyces brevispora]